jgi:hypothetical protein
MEDSPRMARRSFHQSLRLEDQWKVRRAWRGESSIFADVLHQLVDSRPARLRQSVDSRSRRSANRSGDAVRYPRRNTELTAFDSGCGQAASRAAGSGLGLHFQSDAVQHHMPALIRHEQGSYLAEHRLVSGTRLLEIALARLTLALERALEQPLNAFPTITIPVAHS